MIISDSFSVFSHVLNFSILIYFITFLLSIDYLTSFDLIISFIGIFVSLVANILSVLEKTNNS
jgi:hypothetical protein